MKKIFALDTLEDTADLATYLTPLIKCGDVILLYGELGAGKTTFAKELGNALGITDEIDSPSFILLKEYHTGMLPLYHLDLYRMKEEDELMDLGIFDMIESGVTLIEWPELAENLLPYKNLCIRFVYDGEKRFAEISGDDRFLDHLD